ERLEHKLVINSAGKEKVDGHDIRRSVRGNRVRIPEVSGDPHGLPAIERELLPDVEHAVVELKPEKAFPLPIGEEMVYSPRLDAVATMRPPPRRQVVNREPRFIVGSVAGSPPLREVLADLRFSELVLPPSHQ